MSRAFYRGCELALMERTAAGDSAGENLVPFGQAFPAFESLNVLVINKRRLFHAKSADLLLRASVRAVLTAFVVIELFSFWHYIYSLLVKIKMGNRRHR